MPKLCAVYAIIEDDVSHSSFLRGRQLIEYVLNFDEAVKNTEEFHRGLRYRFIQTHTGILLEDTGEIFLLANPKPVLKIKPEKE